jgi:hypothetical protein
MRTLEESFAPCDEAIALHQLGINKTQVSCHAAYINKKFSLGFFHSSHCAEDLVLAPTYAQAFDFLRSHFRIEGWVQPYLSPEPRKCEAKFWYGGRTPTEGTSVGIYDTFMEAELECVRAIIQFIKEYDISIKYI